MQKQPSKGFFKKGLIRNFAEFTSKHVPESLFLINLNSIDLQLLLKQDYSAGVLVNFVKFVRTPFLKNTTRRSLLIIAVSIVLALQFHGISNEVRIGKRNCKF